MTILVIIMWILLGLSFWIHATIITDKKITVADLIYLPLSIIYAPAIFIIFFISICGKDLGEIVIWERSK